MKISFKNKTVFMAILLLVSFSCTKMDSTNGNAFDADGSLIHFDEFNTIIGEVGITTEMDSTSGKNFMRFAYRGKGVYAPRISIFENSKKVAQKDFNLLHMKFKVISEDEMQKKIHLRLEKEGSPDFSTSIALFDYTSPQKDENGLYDCFIPLDYFLCPTDSISHLQLFGSDYGSRNVDIKTDFDLYYLALEKVDEISKYYADFGVPKLDSDINKRIAKIKEAIFKGDLTTSNGNNTRAGEGFTGEELFELQKELRLLVHENLDKAPGNRELEILKLLRYGKPDREISYVDVQEKYKKEAVKNDGKVVLFYDGYDVYLDIRRFRATKDIRYLESAMVIADYVMADPKSGKIDIDRIIELANNNGTLGLGRGFAGVCEAIIEIQKMPELHNKIAPSFYGAGRTYMESAKQWMPLVVELIDEFNKISNYENGKWIEGDGMSINRFLYYTHLLVAASESAKLMGVPEYNLWSEKTRQMAEEILSFFQGDCLFTNDRLTPSKRNMMTWDEYKKVFVSKYGPYVIWAYAHPRSNTEDFAHIQMDIEAIESILQLDESLLREDFKKMMSTMLFIATFNTVTGGMQRDICPDMPGNPPGKYPPWHIHYVHEYGRYIGKYCAEEAYEEFMRYQLLVWDEQLINGQLGRLSQYPMPREIIEARYFRYYPQASLVGFY